MHVPSTLREGMVWDQRTILPGKSRQRRQNLRVFSIARPPERFMAEMLATRACASLVVQRPAVFIDRRYPSRESFVR